VQATLNWRKRKMKHFLFAATGLAALMGSLGPLAAADMTRPAYRAPQQVYVAPPPYNWTGVYIGANAGYGWGTTSWSALGSNFNVNGGLVGGQLGYNWQFGQFVYGIEGDIDWSGIKGNSANNGFAGCFGNVCTTNNHFISTVRGRAGVAIDRWLPYVTGGLAVGNIESTTPFTTGVNQTNAGWTIGAGLEYAFAPNWSAKVEYLYVDLGNASCGFSCGFPAGNTVDFTTNIVRGGVNFHF
jgi:outer membrane immunogenic protein